MARHTNYPWQALKVWQFLISRHEFWSIVLCEGASENSKPSQISAKTNI